MNIDCDECLARSQDDGKLERAIERLEEEVRRLRRERALAIEAWFNKSPYLDLDGRPVTVEGSHEG